MAIPLHDQVSRYVRQAADGGEVFVTMRGQRVARLSPLESGDPLADQLARGLVREPARPKRAISGRKRLKAAAPVSDLVDEQRR
jgi:antitoxin (DNA-binding transcriptional repressor) of toxin-antitoxin stability system